MSYKLNDFHRNVPDEELLADLMRVLNLSKTTTLTTSQYNELGKFHFATYQKRFGSWKNALEKAGLTSSWNRNITELDLFENIERVWIELGRQPTQRDLQPPISKYAVKPYYTKFGTWRKSLEAFIEFINSEVDQVAYDKSNFGEEQFEKSQKPEIVIRHKTKRIPSERLKVQVLMRDGNKCRLCGITLTGENIHFDHIYPWSKGGETALENMQILCAPHNLSKGNLEYENTQTEQ
jgi:hypothetical protein